MFYPYFISILTRSCLALNFQQLFSTFIVTSKNPFQIGCTDGIFVFQIMFSYGLRSKCADLLDCYNLLPIKNVTAKPFFPVSMNPESHCYTAI